MTQYLCGRQPVRMESSESELEEGEVIHRFPVKFKKDKEDNQIDVSRKHLLENFIFCPNCSEKFIRKFNGKDKFENHLLRHKVDEFSCDCPKDAEQKQENEFNKKLKHMMVQHEGWHGCHVCEKFFKIKEQLKEHIKLQHPNENKSAKQKKNMGIPRNTESGVVICTDCDKTFNKYDIHLKRNIKKHKLQHEIDKFSCDCPDYLNDTFMSEIKAFYKKQYHVKLKHLGWIGCEQCNECFETENNLATHSKKHKITFQM